MLPARGSLDAASHSRDKSPGNFPELRLAQLTFLLWLEYGPGNTIQNQTGLGAAQNPELSRDLRPQLFEQEKLPQVVLKRKTCQKPALRKPHVSMPCLRLELIYNTRTQQEPVASAQQIIFYERQHSLPNTFSLVLTQYVDQADKCGAAAMSWPQKA